MNPNLYHKTRVRSKYLILGKSDATSGSNYDDVIESGVMQRKLMLMEKLSRVSLFEKIWYAIFILAGILCLIFIRPFDIELIFAVVSLYLYMVSNNLTANGNKFGMLVVIISSLLYVVNCFFYKIYGEIFVNVFLYIPIYIFSFVSFYKNTNKENKKDEFLEVKKLGVLKLLLCVLILLAGTAVLWLILKVINSAFPLVNAVSIVAFLIAMVIRLLRYIEFWWFDTLGNIFNVVLWVLASVSDISSLPFVLSSVSSMFNAIYGYIIWKKLYRKSQASRGVLLVKRKLKIGKIIKVRRRYRNLVFNELINKNESAKEG